MCIRDRVYFDVLEEFRGPHHVQESHQNDTGLESISVIIREARLSLYLIRDFRFFPDCYVRAFDHCRRTLNLLHRYHTVDYSLYRDSRFPACLVHIEGF